MDQALNLADKLEEQAYREIDKAYGDRVSSVIRKHRPVLKKIGKMDPDKDMRRIRILLRTSGLIDDLTDAFSASGQEAAKVIRMEVQGVREAENQ